jgi:hypothetical protein
MSEVKVNKISPRTACGTVTLGDSGDTFTIPAGATINNQGTAVNFGATGSASWVTTVKTTGFTAVAGEGYFCNTTSGGFSVNLPAGTAGAVVAIKDYAGTFDTGTLTLVQNGSDKIGGSAINATLTTEGIAVTLVFIDSTQGWLVTDSGLQSESPTAQYVTATGGTITTSSDYKIHTFTGPGTFCISCAGNAAGSNAVDYLVVAGGGGAGQYYGGGGGGGGFRESPGTVSGSYTVSPLGASPAVALTLPATAYPITVGGGGATTPGSTVYQPGSNGSSSVFSSITSAGGGFGGASQPSGAAGGPGGSGGGGGGTTGGGGGSGNTPPVSPPQGKDGRTVGGTQAGAGGGATIAGGTNPDGKTGGTGATTSITSSAVGYSGGGGGGPQSATSTAPCGSGGSNVSGTPAPLRAGQTNRGGGGGADFNVGGSGIVVIRYKFQN